MNKFLIVFPLFTALFSNATYAIHAYRSENCVSNAYNFNYLGNYPYGGNYELYKNGQDSDADKVLALPLSQNEESDILFSTQTAVVTESKPTVHDCWFDYDEWTSTKEILIEKITDKASLKLGLKAGDVVSFICKETMEVPNDNECSK